MSDTETLDQLDAAAVPRVYTRSASTSVEVVDEDRGVMLGRIFPFGEIAHVREMVDGRLQDYDEHFLPGCTTRLRQVIDKIGNARFLGLQLGHDEPGVSRQLGFGTGLEERADGAYGTFQLYTKRNDYALVREMLGTAWSGLSVSFADRVPPVVQTSGTRSLVGRRQVDIEHIAAVNVPAYRSAGVMSIRESDTPDPGTPDLDAAVALLAELRAESAARPARHP